MTTNDMITARINKLLTAIDKTTEQVRRLQHEQQMRVRDNGGRERLVGLRACQFLHAADHALSGVRAMLFNDSTVDWSGPNGEAMTEQNSEWLSMRFHDSAGNLGLKFEDASDAVLEAAETQCQQANDLLNEAVIWSMAG